MIDEDHLRFAIRSEFRASPTFDTPLITGCTLKPADRRRVFQSLARATHRWALVVRRGGGTGYDDLYLCLRCIAEAGTTRQRRMARMIKKRLDWLTGVVR